MSKNNKIQILKRAGIVLFAPIWIPIALIGAILFGGVAVLYAIPYYVITGRDLFKELYW